MHRALWIPLAALMVAPSALAIAEPPPLTGACVQVFNFPDNGLAYCVRTEGSCLLIEVRETFAGQVERCVVPNPL